MYDIPALVYHTITLFEIPVFSLLTVAGINFVHADAEYCVAGDRGLNLFGVPISGLRPSC